MLRPNGDCGKVRKGNSLSLPNRPIYAQKTRGSKRNVFKLSFGFARLVFSGRQKHSGQQDLHRRRRISATAVLDAFSSFNQVHDTAPTSDSASIGCGNWCNVGRLVEKEKAGAIWVKVPVSLAATGTTGRIPVLVALIGTMIHRTRTTTSVGVASVSTRNNCSANATAWQADHLKCGQPVLSSFGEYSTWFGITLSRKSKGGANIYA